VLALLHLEAPSNRWSFSIITGGVYRGQVKINNGGKLIYIDNDSGHYKPNTRALRDVVDVICNHYHATLFGLSVMDKVTGNTVNAM
jgi:hypothetical protein